MRIFGIGDLHLSFGIRGKEMHMFGPAWQDHPKPLQQKWDSLVSPEDLVLIPGDISWAKRMDEAKPDLQWIEERPGTKVMIKGNHDYWWDSISKVRKALPNSLHAIQNDCQMIGDIAICGTRLWDSTEYDFSSIIDYKGEPLSPQKEQEDAALFERELQRLEMSLKMIPKSAQIKIAMTHYPPIGLKLEPSRVSTLLESYGVTLCLFGHLHGIRDGTPPLFGEARGVQYVLTACDWLQSKPIRVF